MENKLPENSSTENGENPGSVLIKIVVTTLATLAVGGLFLMLGLV
ncbi:MAG: hypothetical protein PHD82_12255 [Candidatus Riflebacteria bacterium]|jgi:hypothetical protein|nr:hypothetical protein [Candidatus Riflebacteria bacterium]